MPFQGSGDSLVTLTFLFFFPDLYFCFLAGFVFERNLANLVRNTGRRFPPIFEFGGEIQIFWWFVSQKAYIIFKMAGLLILFLLDTFFLLAGMHQFRLLQVFFLIGGEILGLLIL